MTDIYKSKVARLLKFIKGENEYAITTSKNCCRYSCQENEVSPKWRKHEETHKAQFSRLGWVNFIFQYCIESIRHGYKNNKFEIEARN
jgi:hypothetical protein